MKSDKIIILILILGLLLRLISLNQSFWLDEATSAQVVRNFSYKEIIGKFSLGDFHPPFYYLLLKSWANIFGIGEIGLRSLSVLAGAASVYVIYLIGSEINKKAGILSALFLAVNGLHIYYSQEARMYALAALLTCLTVYFFIKTLAGKKTLYWILFSISLALNSLTDYLPNLIIPVLWIAAVKFKNNNEWWRNYFVSHIPLVLIWFFWTPFFLKQMSFGVSAESSAPLWWEILGKTNLKNLLLVPVKFVLGRISFENNIVYFMVAASVLSGYILIILAGFGGLIKHKHSFLGWLLVPLFASALLGMRIPVFYYFRFLFVLPAFILILAGSIIHLPSKQQKAAIYFVFTVSILSSLYYLTNPKFQREDWRSTASYIEKNSTNDSFSVVFSSGKQTEAYSYYGMAEKIVRADQLGSGGGVEKIWLIKYVQDLFDPGDTAVSYIERVGYSKVKNHNFNGIIVWEYEKL